MLVRNLAIEERRRNDRSIVVTLHPGTVDTDLSRPFQAMLWRENCSMPNVRPCNCWM
jgi:NAD(P)-dependent dehydrogenase (short-subunit alcohol dehydrogenase family)